jgi:hypothetical protein
MSYKKPVALQMNTLQFINFIIMRWCRISIKVTIVMMEQQKEELKE